MAMALRFTLRLRVAAGFALLGLAVSLALGGWLFFVSRDLEQRLIDEALDAELQDYQARLARNPRSLPPETAALRGWIEGRSPEAGITDDPVPQPLRALPAGRHTLELEGASYRAAVHLGPGPTLYMLHSRAQLARRDRQLALMLVLGMTLTALLSAAGGWWLAGRVTAPVRALALRVRGREPTDPLPPLLPSGPPDLPADEVGELAHTIDGYLRRLRAFVERERTFVSGVSHELRTPLAVIAGAVEVLESDPGLGPRNRERLGRIARATQGMSDLAAALLVLAREGQGQTSPPTPCPVAEVLAESVELHRPLLAHKPVELKLAIEARPLLAVARPLLAIALGNLIRNACAYTEQGWVAVTLSQTEVLVEDTGPGIPESELACLFGQDPNCPRQVRGAGIGLPLVKRIADAQGWRVAAEGRAGGGAAFRLSFAPETKGPAAPHRPQERLQPR
jgi:signal transduction histidine kinase